MKINIEQDVLGMVAVGSLKTGEVFLFREGGAAEARAYFKLPDIVNGYGHAQSLRLSDNTVYTFNPTSKVMPTDAELTVKKRG